MGDLTSRLVTMQSDVELNRARYSQSRPKLEKGTVQENTMALELYLVIMKHL